MRDLQCQKVGVMYQKMSVYVQGLFGEFVKGNIEKGVCRI